MPRVKGIGKLKKRRGRPPNYKTKNSSHGNDLAVCENIIIAHEDTVTKVDVVQQILVNDAMASGGIEEGIEAEDDEENNNMSCDKNPSNPGSFGAIITSQDKEYAKLVQGEENCSDTVIVNCDERHPDSVTESQDENDRIMKILAEYRQGMGYTMDNISHTSLDNENTKNMTEQNSLGQAHSCVNQLTAISASDEPLNLTCQDEVFDIKPVIVNSTAQYDNESLNLICQDETPGEKPPLKCPEKYVVIKNDYEDFEAARKYSDLVKKCSLLTTVTDKFTFIKNTGTVRFVQLYDMEISKIKLAVSVKCDFIVNVTVNDKLLPADHDIWAHIPKLCLTVQHIEILLKTLATYRVCIGNPDEELQNVMHFPEKNEEVSEHNYKGYRDEYIGSTIRSQNCPLLIRYKKCQNCLTYRRCLKRQLQRKNVESEPSETNWLQSKKANSLLLESEKLEKLKQMREHILQLEKKIIGLHRDSREKKTEKQSNNKRNKSTMTENMDTLMTDLGPELVETKTSMIVQQSASHPMNTSTTLLPTSGDSHDVSVKDEPISKTNDIIGVFKTQSGVSKPVIIKIINDKTKKLGESFPAPRNLNIAGTSKAGNNRDIDKETSEIQAVFKDNADRLNHLENSLEEKWTETKSNKPQNNQGQVCKICNKVVKHMRGHMIIHRPVKRFKCSICEKAFHKNSSLEMHASVHTGEKAHKCPICDQRFSYLSNMKRHLLIHTGVRPYKCSHCPKCFVSKSRRREHEQAMHTGVKSFACKICSVMFKTTGALSTHKSIHHEQPDDSPKPHLCDQCGKCYKSKFSLWSHKNIHKNKKKNC